MQQNTWSDEETILALYYYYQIPYGSISGRNETIKEIASLIGRTPGAVCKKMGNLASHDPEMARRNKVGLQHSSKRDELIVKRYLDDWDTLSREALAIEATLRGKSVEDIAGIKDADTSVGGDSLPLEERIARFYFRDIVLGTYNNSCCITGMTEPRLLIASYIKPWSKLNNQNERLNPRNGLCLNALHEKSFSSGLMTILPDYTIRLSSELKGEDDCTRWLKQFDKHEIILPEKYLPSKEFLEYHNDVVFVA